MKNNTTLTPYQKFIIEHKDIFARHDYNGEDNYCLKHNSFAFQFYDNSKCKEFLELFGKFSGENKYLVKNDETCMKTYAKNLMEFNVNEECDLISFPSLEDLNDILKSKGYVHMLFSEDSFRCSQDKMEKGFEIYEIDQKLAVARVIGQIE